VRERGRAPVRLPHAHAALPRLIPTLSPANKHASVLRDASAPGFFLGGAMPKLIERGQMRFPLLDASARLVGWTARAPAFEGNALRHREAEKLVGTPIVILPVLLMDDAHILLAGGEPNPEGLWALAIAHVGCVRRMPIVVRGE
jgi:hypothetical protein